jgi:YD repeat-containing protein
MYLYVFCDFYSEGPVTHGIDTGYSPNGFDAGFTASLCFKPSSLVGARRLIAWNTSLEARIDFLTNGSNLIGRACQAHTTYIGRQRIAIIDTTWQKLTMTYDGSGLSSGVKLYRNGVAVDNADSNAGTFTGVPATSTDNIPILSYATNTQQNPATGQADLIEITAGVARTASEELALFNLQKGRFGI